MWTVLKFHKSELSLFKEDLIKNLGKDFQLYIPKIRIQKYKKNKLINIDLNLLGDYLFCYHESFKNKETISSMKFIKGLKYFLNGFNESQESIKRFIQECKSTENDQGFVSREILDLKLEKKYKFLNGPFSNQIFEILKLQKEKIRIVTGNLTTTISKKRFLFLSV